MKIPSHAFQLLGSVLIASSIEHRLVSAHGIDHDGHDHHHHHHHHDPRKLRGLVDIPDETSDGDNPFLGEEICTTPKPNKSDRARANNAMKQWKKNKNNRRLQGEIVVNTYMHIIHPGRDPFDNEVHQNEQAQIDVLNAAFPGYRFELIEINTRRDRNWWDITNDSSAEAQMKAELRRGGAADLNIYYVNPATTSLGWASFPWRFNGNPNDDGVVCRHSTGVGGSSTPYDMGDTLVHEVGHWMGLFHTFQDGCIGPGDGIGDTNAEGQPAYGCPVGRETCGNLDPIFNYMDYTDDDCMNEFTTEQKERMDANWFKYRSTDPAPAPTPTTTTTTTTTTTAATPTTTTTTAATPTTTADTTTTTTTATTPTTTTTTTAATTTTTCVDRRAAAPSGCPPNGINPGCCSGECFANGGNQGLCR